MRKFTAMVAAAAALFVAQLANAAPVNLTFTQQADHSTWQLTLDVAAGVSLTGITQVAFIVTGSSPTDFVITAPTTAVDTFTTSVPSGFSAKLITGNNTHLSLAAGSSGSIGGPGTSLVIGNVLNGTGLHGCQDTSCAGQFTRGDVAGDGGTILDQDFTGIDEALVSVKFVPEPGAMLLLGIGIAGLSLVRRKA